MEWKKKQWIRCDFGPMRGEDGEVKPSYCFYKIRNIQPVKGTFTICYPAYVFSLDDGSVIIGKEKAPFYGKASPLSGKDAVYVNKILAEHPLAFAILSPEKDRLGD
jgi:hypothetical protein